MRWIVGDVHGCALELEDLLETVRFDPARDELWTVGDLVNKGPDSAAALRLWSDLEGRAVIGNHDVYTLLAASGAMPRKSKDTLQGLIDADDRDALLGRLRAQPLIVHFSGETPADDVWLVHAGLDPRWEDPGAVAAANDVGTIDHDDDWLLSDDVATATRIRCCTADGEMAPHAGPPEECREPFRPWDAFYRGAALVVHGHWAMRGYYQGARTIGLDSGCCYGGPLTAWCHEERRVVQVPSRQG